jgi:uncharacterized protein involved in exopolysaccharide biosynthesis
MGFIPEWAIGVAFIMLAISIARAFSRTLRGSRTPPISDNEIGELRQTLDAMQNRVGELEERLDFAERLLAKYRDTERLGSPPQ